MAEPKRTDRERDHRTGDAREPDVSPEGVPYQSSGWPETEENSGPFESGEGKNSPLLKANQEAAQEREAELDRTAKETPPR